MLLLTTIVVIVYQCTVTNAKVILAAAAQAPVVMAHRGCCASGVGGHAPENTLEAFEYARSVGAVLFETDLRFTADREIVLMHDINLDRTTNCSGLISDWTAADIRSHCEAGSWLDPRFAGGSVRVPSLPDLLHFVSNSGMSVVLDLKERGLMPSVVRAAEATAGLDRVQLIPAINFHDDAKDVVPFSKRSTVVLNPNADAPIPLSLHATYFGDLREAGIDVLYPPYRTSPPTTTQELGAAAARYGMQIWTWTIDAPEDLLGAAAAGARAVCTNDPKGALELYRDWQMCAAERCGNATGRTSGTVPGRFPPSTNQREERIEKRTINNNGNKNNRYSFY